MLSSRVAFVLRTQALLFFLTSVGLIVQPLKIAAALGFASSSLSTQLSWTLRTLGVMLLVPALLAPLVAAFAGERGLRQASSGMGFIMTALSAWMPFSPGRWSSSKSAVEAIFLVLACAYFFALRGRRRNR